VGSIGIRAGLFAEIDNRGSVSASEFVACHEHGTAVGGLLPGSWDHLFCQSWDHPARLAGGSWVGSLTACVVIVDVEVSADGIQGGQRGRGA
jgi:hypothetical protein